ncbi:adenosine deaminase-like protein [Harpegnathos saltator]|uniref:Adenosine deaminase-like protein n=1 Tax=Harpegnathos saltator TaxID=610380 RepID=E2B4Y9_HARSA|nr:adenosine deaminase-like protein [Harpegnathos saltator]XP_011144230.1 adenosine deaminase-like protein [Harpegnathos saltator]XP_011144240.1 adenosine deaminase-like protein [Harpegnathos saltator]EFN89253.1 Adenosine deaminase-like protein [Harpegnathos saltator]
MDMQDFCHKLPKVELHAHLNGSLSLDTLQKLYKMQQSDDQISTCDQTFMNIRNLSSLSECFKVFEVAHALTITPQAVFVATCDVIRDFYEDNVIYLELRSTPRAVEGSMTKEDYLEAMIKAIGTSKSECPRILVKLLVSINRKYGYESAKENVNFAIQFMKKYPEYVIGLDLSGDPTVEGSFVELLVIAKKAGLKIAAHCAEIPDEKETIDILKLKPDRLGHCTCIHPSLQGSEQLFDMLLQSKIPVELCLTSNIKCKTVSSYAVHHFKYLYKAGHPITIGTDDKGVFDTCLSNEFQILSSVFNVGREQLKELSVLSVQYSFASTEEKEKLTSIIKNFLINI